MCMNTCLEQETMERWMNKRELPNVVLRVTTLAHCFAWNDILKDVQLQ